jgi:hypothetical protein
MPYVQPASGRVHAAAAVHFLGATSCGRQSADASSETLANLWQAALSGCPADALCLVELRGFEPLTPCMPSRDPDRSGPTKPRITRHATEAVVVTRGVSRGLVRLQLLPRCPPNDHEHAPPPGPRRWRPLPCESESGDFLTMGRIAAAPAWRNRTKSQGREPARIHECASRSPQRAAACRTCVGAAGAASAGDRWAIT